jgi:hypothetical protein
MDWEHQQNKPNKSIGEKTKSSNKRTHAWRNSTRGQAYAKEYTGTIHLVTTENSIQLPTTTNINRRLSIRVPNKQKELGCMLRGCRVHILRRDFQFFQLEFETLQLFVPNKQEARGLHSVSVIFLWKIARHLKDFFKTRPLQGFTSKEPGMKEVFEFNHEML